MTRLLKTKENIICLVLIIILAVLLFNAFALRHYYHEQMGTFEITSLHILCFKMQDMNDFVELEQLTQEKYTELYDEFKEARTYIELSPRIGFINDCLEGRISEVMNKYLLEYEYFDHLDIELWRILDENFDYEDGGYMAYKYFEKESNRIDLANRLECDLPNESEVQNEAH